MPVPAEFTGRDDALAWLNAERPSLTAAATTAAAVGRHQEVMRLPLSMGEYLGWRRRSDDWLAVLAVCCDSACQLNDKSNEAAALGSLGVALRYVRRFEEAIGAHEAAAAIFRETCDRHRGDLTLDNLARAYREMRRPGRAAARWREAAAAMRDAGDREEAARLDQKAADAQAGQGT